jgi:23S rRNA pseudouridine1911/1915/1917 synthase
MDSHHKYKISNIPVMYEDDWLLVVDKPSGLLTIPTPKKESRTLTSILNDYLKGQNLPYHLYPCHRLDRETSGLIIYAKGRSAQKKMADEFRNRKIKKLYFALVKGMPSAMQAEIRIPIEGRSAVTRYKVVEKKKNFAIVEAQPLSGRTNQIRIHFKLIGHPVLGETKYALRRDFLVKAKRLCLHAQALEFIHPLTKEIIRLSAGLPQDLITFLKKYD